MNILEVEDNMSSLEMNWTEVTLLRISELKSKSSVVQHEPRR